MATSNPDPVNGLSADQRALVRACIDLKLQSVQRAAKAASNPGVAKALQAEYSDLEALKSVFRS